MHKPEGRMLRGRVLRIQHILIFALSLSYAGVPGAEASSLYTVPLEKKFATEMAFIYAHQESLRLSTEQLRQIKNLRRDVSKKLIRQNADFQLVIIDLAGILQEKNPDLGEIQALIEEKYRIKSATMKMLAESLVALRNVLSEDQYRDLEKLWRGRPVDDNPVAAGVSGIAAAASAGDNERQ